MRVYKLLINRNLSLIYEILTQLEDDLDKKLILYPFFKEQIMSP